MKEELKLVIEFTRHGARSPTINDNLGLNWDMGLYRLTALGKRQHY